MSPSTRSNKHLRGLPTNAAPVGVRCISVPVPDDPEWIAAFYGQLQRLSLQSIWDRDEAHTAQIVARRWLEVYLSTMESDCMDDHCTDCLGRLRFNPSTRRVGYTGPDDIGFFEVPDGPWIDNAPTFPAPQPQVGATDDAKRCIASRNAALVLQQFYRETVLIIAAPGINAVLSIMEYFAEALLLYLGGGFAADFLISAARQVLEEALLFDADWTDDENLIVQNILYCASSVDAEGVVTFDYATVLSELGASLLPQLNAAQQLLIAFMGEDGLNVAGGIHNEDSADCSGAGCGDEPWSVTFDWRTGAHGSVSGNYGGCTASRNASGWFTCSTGAQWMMNVIKNPTSNEPTTHLTNVTFTLAPWSTSSQTDGSVNNFVYVWTSEGRLTIPFTVPGGSSAPITVSSGPIDRVIVGEMGIVNQMTGASGLTWQTITLEGYGPNPYL